MSLEVVREADGQIISGAANPTGRNQWNTPRLQNVARIDLALEMRMQEDPFCAQEVVDQIVEALKDLKADKALEIVRFFLSPGALELVLGSAAVNPPEPPAPDAKLVSAFDELASDFGSVFPAGAELAEGDA